MSELVLNRPIYYVEKPEFPHNMLVELTNVCNHDCIFCGYKNMKRKKSMCDKEFTKDIIRQAYKNGTREIGFYLIGEPFIYPYLEEMVRYCHEIGFVYIYLDTNAVLATVDKVKKLVDSGLNSLKFSVNAASKETYRKVHGHDDFEKVLYNITEIHKYVIERDSSLKTFISFVKNNLNEYEVEQLYDLFSALVDKIYVYDVLNQGGSASELVQNGVVDSIDQVATLSCPCDMIFNKLHITVEGYLSPCCGDYDGYLSAVDLHQTSLQEAWNDARLVELRRKHLLGDLSGTLCYNCIHKADNKIYPLNVVWCKRC